MIDLGIWEELNRAQAIPKPESGGGVQENMDMLCNCKQGREIFNGMRRDGTLNSTCCGDVDHFHLPATK